MSSDIRGAATDRCSFYSTTSSITYQDFLPVLQKKFTLHLSPNPEKVRTTSLPTILSHKMGSGYSKNTSSFVKYDKLVDEKGAVKFSEQAYLTTTAKDYAPPPKQGRAFEKIRIVSHQEIADSGFTQIPRRLPIEHVRLNAYLRNFQSFLKWAADIDPKW